MKVLPRNTVLVGDAARIVGELLPESVDAVVTSPPYPGGVRDYRAAGQLGSERSIDGYVTNVRNVMRAVRQVLKPTGSLWLNLGDLYARSARQGVPVGGLLLAPQRLALALAADGWLIRNVCIWHKRNPLPQSAPDRLSPTYEVLILATKQRRYFFDLDRIREPHRSAGRVARPKEAGRRYRGGNAGLGALKAAGRVGHIAGKNPGDVWSVATASDRLGHQASFPEKLIERPILASCPERICVECDRPWRRPVRLLTVHTAEGSRAIQRVGQLERCACFAPSRPGVVLDPFVGTGTVGVVAERFGRDWLGVELNPAYAALARQRIAAASRRAA
jgi:site-specific DNA-methyltransferase (adenine-specific)